MEILQSNAEKWKRKSSHSCSHTYFLDFNKEKMEIELLKPRQTLEDRPGYHIRSFSIPFGFGNQNIIELAIGSGYQTICTSEVKLSRFNTDLSVYGRIGLRRGDGVGKFKKIVEMEWQTIGKMIIEDRIKSILKRFMGRGLWLKIRYRILSQSQRT